MPLMKEYYIIFRALRLILGIVWSISKNSSLNPAQETAYLEVATLLTKEIERK